MQGPFHGRKDQVESALLLWKLKYLMVKKELQFQQDVGLLNSSEGLQSCNNTLQLSWYTIVSQIVYQENVLMGEIKMSMFD